MTFWEMITSNYLINVGVTSWAAAQLLKLILTLVTTRELVLERLVGAGGMPSAHSALVCSMTVAMAKAEGFQSPVFALTVAFAAVVMYDAMGVRRAAGEHAKALNKMAFDLRNLNQNLSDFFSDISTSEASKEAKEEKELKEFLGHTPLQVLGGALLGILIAAVMPM